MDRGIPKSNKLISKRIQERNMRIHQEKLADVKSSISRAVPLSFAHLKSNKKKNQQYEDKLTEIERENRILLEKLTQIMKTGNNSNLNNKFPKSLNKDHRKRELVKITIENQALLKRLNDQRSDYDHSKWENDRRQNEQYLKRISEYPLMLYTTSSKTPKNFNDNLRPKTYNDEFFMMKSGLQMYSREKFASTSNMEKRN